MRRLMMQKYGGEPSISFPTIFKVENIVLSYNHKDYTLNEPINPTNKFIIKGNFSIQDDNIVAERMILEVAHIKNMVFFVTCAPLFRIELTSEYKIVIKFYTNSSKYVSIVSQDACALNTEYEFEFYFDNESIKEEIRLWKNVGGKLEKLIDVEYNNTITVDDYETITVGNSKDPNKIYRDISATFKYIEIQQES